MKQTDFPQWAQKIKQESEGNVLRMSGEKIYLYKSTSHHVPGKKYPVAKEEYLGIVTPEGLIPAESFQFFPLLTEVRFLVQVFPLPYSDTDLEIASKIVLVNKKGKWLLPKISEAEETIIRKYLNIEKGEVRMR